MRVLFSTTGGAGHFGPLLPFARGCVDAGQDVLVAAPASFAPVVERAGLTAAAFDDVPGHLLGAVYGRVPRLTFAVADELVVREVFGRLSVTAALPGLRDVVTAWRPDVVVREPMELASHVVALEASVPQVQVNIGLDSLLDRLTGLDQPLTELGAPGIQVLRDQPRWTLVPPSLDVRASGVADEPLRFREPATLAAAAPAALPDWWTDADAPLVYVSFGSVAATMGLFPRLYRSVLDRLAEVAVRVLLTTGEAADPGALGPLPRNAHVERFWPQAEVMPHATVVVGHGGFGTTLLAVAAGLPQVAVPLFSFDQLDNARRVAEVGAGVALVDPGTEDRLAGELLPAGPAAVERLADAVTTVLTHRDQARVARELATEMAELPDAASCVVALADLVG